MLVLLVVVFPLASWYYLNTGLNFRKKGIKDLASKGILRTEDSELTQILKHKTAIIFRDPGLIDDMTIIHDQFDDMKSFTLVQITEDNLNIKPTWVKHNLTPTAEDSLFSNNKAVILVDTSSQIRYVYNANNFEPGRLVEYLSIILPRAVEPDIKVRQNAGK